MSEPIELWTLAETAERLRVSERTVRRLIAAGRIRATRVGRRPLVTSREIAAYVAAQTRRVA